MKKLIAVTVLLVTATVLITLLYFKNLNPPGHTAANVMQAIPASAAFVFEFSNDGGFYDAYDSSALFTSIAGTEQLHDLNVLRQQLLQNPSLKPYFDNQDIYISVHPQGDLLLTLHSAQLLSVQMVSQAFLQGNSNIKVKALQIGRAKGFTITLPGLTRRFQVIDRGHHIYSGSFSAELISEIAQEARTPKSPTFTVLPAQEQTNALANLYVSYTALNPLFDHWFKAKNTDYLKSLRLLPANAALTLNYKSDALMFSGYTELLPQLPASYLTLFKNQRPYHNQLKDLFPSITAFSTCFSVSDPLRFQHDLSAWQDKANLTKERRTLMNHIKDETGVNLLMEFTGELGNEFALLTTRFDDQLAVIQLKDGSKMQPVLANISTSATEGIGKFNYAKLPFFLLGDAFTLFRQPYYAIADNYLILANSPAALNNYLQIYNSQTFLSKQERYNQFDDLLAEQCNVDFFVHFKNASYLLKRDLRPVAWQAVHSQVKGTPDYYAGSYQLSSADKQFYTNFCLQLNKPDILKTK